MKLTTIKKTAPLGLLAVVLSGTAFAGKNDNPGKGPKNDQPNNDQQVSIDVFSLCDVEYKVDMVSGKPVPYFTVTTEITNMSDDSPGEIPGASADAQITKIQVVGKHKSRGKENDLGFVGTVNYPILDGEDNIIEDGIVGAEPDALSADFEVNLCTAAGFDDTRDSSLNAEITVWVDGAKFETYGGRCDDDPSDNYLMVCTDPATQTCDENDEFVIDENGDPVVVLGPDDSNVGIEANKCY
jgi:hypothetical protein